MFCKHVEKKGTGQFELFDDVICTIENKKYKLTKESHLFPEKPYMNFLLEKLELGNFRSRYGFLSKMRNHLDIIHYKTMPENFDQVIGDRHDADLPELSLKHLYDMLEIFYKIFTKKDFPYFQIRS